MGLPGRILPVEQAEDGGPGAAHAGPQGPAADEEVLQVEHPGPLPNSGVFARHNAISIPALLPDGTVAEKSVSKTLTMRGVVVDVNELRAPTTSAYAAIERRDAAIEGDDE